MKYKIEISDNEGNSCRIKINVPWDTSDAATTNSRWKVLDEGFIKYRSGGCDASRLGFAEPVDLYLYRGEESGIVLYEFADWASFVNDSGTGTIQQPWCVTLVPYHITWARV